MAVDVEDDFVLASCTHVAAVLPVEELAGAVACLTRVDVVAVAEEADEGKLHLLEVEGGKLFCLGQLLSLDEVGEVEDERNLVGELDAKGGVVSQLCVEQVVSRIAVNEGFVVVLAYDDAHCGAAGQQVGAHVEVDESWEQGFVGVLEEEHQRFGCVTAVEG